MKKYLDQILKYRFMLFSLIILGLFGFSLWKIQALSNPQPDPDYIRSQQTNQLQEIKIEDSLRQELESLVATPVDTEPENLGHPDPFNP